MTEISEGEYQAYSDPPAPEGAAVWTCQDGRQIAVKDMTIPHIRNALAMLKRKGMVGPRTLAPYLFGTGPMGEAASAAFDAEFNELLQRPVDRFVDVFEAELRSRGETA